MQSYMYHLKVLICYTVSETICLTDLCTCDLYYTVKMNMLYLINIIVATDYKQYY